MIPYGKQDISDDDINSVIEVLKSDFLTQGPIVPKFENALCSYTGASYSIATNSATSSLHIACLALGLGPGDILWTSPITFVASANCALYCHASVDFVDVDPSTALMSIDNLREKLENAKAIGKLPKIVVPVHFSGQSCDMQSIYDLGIEYGFSIIEDAAHAIGAYYKGQPVGNCRFSDITVLSFHPVKIITTGEGGASLTNNKSLAHKMKMFRSHGIERVENKNKNVTSDSWIYDQKLLGYNYRMTDISAALGISQLKRLDYYVSKRLEIVTWYNEKISELDLKPLQIGSNNKSSHHLYVVRLNSKSLIRGKVFDYMRESGIGVNVHYIPVYKHSYFNSDIQLIGAEEYYNSAITLPLFPHIKINELEKVVKTLHSALKHIK
jgi:UDP-4-amino-4,6-dideoxy-N-acetyl-beta-L-altrosamine transaminase